MADLSFLSGAFHLVAIHPDTAHVVGYHFADDRGAAEVWADQWNAAGYGLYWTTNTVRPSIHAKPSKAQLLAARVFHVDLDDTQDASRLESLGASVIISSGNGLQGVWHISGPCSLSDVEEVNKRIAAALGADHCWNCERLLRVPGTINYPNAIKRTRGRVPAPAALLRSSAAAYTLESMLAAFPPVPERPEDDGPDEYDPGPWEPIALDELEPAPRGTLAVKLDYVPPHGERSEHVAECVVALARAGYPAATILGLLMDPRNPGLHEHIADQPNPLRQARRKLALGEAVRRDIAAELAGVSFALPVGAPTVKMAAPDVPSGPRYMTDGLPPVQRSIMHGFQMVDHFKGCIYVVQDNAILMPSGELLDSQRFDSVKGGHRFMYRSDGGTPTKSAFEAMVRSEVYNGAKVDATCFRPELPPFAIVEDGGKILINTYTPIKVERRAGDPGPFIRHVRKMLPEGNDAEVLLTYLASVVQNPGRKAQWWPVVQGAEGNGKSMLLAIMQHAIGEKYTHLPNSAKITRNGINFNAWMRRALFLGVEEIYSSNRRDFLEEFKPYVTNERLTIEGKGKDEFTGDNRANGILLTNHRDGVPVTRDTRRYAPLFCAQQSKADCERDGMAGDYFPALWDWLRSGGFAIVSDFLHTYTGDAAVCPYRGAQARAPATSSSGAAVEAGRGRVEQEILEAIGEARPGFAGDWVSSIMLNRLLESIRAGVAHSKRNDLMESLDYVPHPALPNGRVNNPVGPDNGKPRLWVRRGSISHLNLTDGASVAAAYSAAQTKAQMAGAALGLR